jgi:hypothetical protein
VSVKYVLALKEEHRAIICENRMRREICDRRIHNLHFLDYLIHKDNIREFGRKIQKEVLRF